MLTSPFTLGYKSRYQNQESLADAVLQPSRLFLTLSFHENIRLTVKFWHINASLGQLTFTMHMQELLNFTGTAMDVIVFYIQRSFLNPSKLSESSCQHRIIAS